MAKILIFVLIIAGVVFYPVIEFQKQPKVKNYNVKNYIPTVVRNGDFFVYEVNLTKEGNFSVLNIITKKKIEAENFMLHNIVKNFVLDSKHVSYNGPVLTGFDVKYSTNDYNLSTVKAVYNDKTKILNGGKFKIFGKTFRGFGKKFKVDAEKNIYADNIKYFLKVNK